MRTDVEVALRELTEELKQHGGSRYVGAGADPEVARRVASGGTVSGKSVTMPGGRTGTIYNPRGGVGFGKALAEATQSSGGYILPIEVSTDVAMLIRSRTAVLKLKPTTVTVGKEFDLPAITTGATAYYTLENSAITTSQQTFSIALALRPKALAALVPISNKLLYDAAVSPDIEKIVQTDVAEVMALRQDLAFITGSGASGEPLGVVNTAGLTPAPNLGTNGATPTFDNLKDTVAGLRAVNAPFKNPGWIFHPRTINTIEKLKTSTGQYLGEEQSLLSFDATGGGGTLLGFPFVTTTQIPVNLTVGTNSDCSYIIFGSDWDEAYVGEGIPLSIELSSEAAYTPDGTTWVSAFQNQQTLLRMTMWHDFGLRRPYLFSVMTGVRP